MELRKKFKNEKFSYFVKQTILRIKKFNFSIYKQNIFSPIFFYMVTTKYILKLKKFNWNN